MEDIIAGRFETDDEARAAAASLADSVNEDDIFIFFNNQPSAHDSERDVAKTNDPRGVPAVGAAATAVGGYTGSLAGTAGGLPGEGKGTNKAHSRAGLMLAVRVANANAKQQIIDCLRQHVGQGH